MPGGGRPRLGPAPLRAPPPSEALRGDRGEPPAPLSRDVEAAHRALARAPPRRRPPPHGPRAAAREGLGAPPSPPPAEGRGFETALRLLSDADGARRRGAAALRRDEEGGNTRSSSHAAGPRRDWKGSGERPAGPRARNGGRPPPLGARRAVTCAGGRALMVPPLLGRAPRTRRHPRPGLGATETLPAPKRLRQWALGAY